MAPTAAVLLHAWESATGAAPPGRAPSLLRSLGAVAPGARTDEMTVGQCDAWLFKLRRVIFGEMLEVVATCPECQNDVELTVALGELQPPLREGAVAPLTVQVDGYTLRCRIPANEDLRILAGRGGRATLRDLLERCVIEANAADGSPVMPRQLPEATVEATIEALAESDPGACTRLRIRCPCGGEWVDELDIRDVLWRELTEWVGRTLTQVHQLAQAYGWSESEVLEMSGWRRRWYLEAAGW